MSQGGILGTEFRIIQMSQGKTLDTEYRIIQMSQGKALDTELKIIRISLSLSLSLLWQIEHELSITHKVVKTRQT